MEDVSKIKAPLIAEIAALCQRIEELEKAEVGVTDEFISDFEGKIHAVVEKDTAQRDAGNFISPEKTLMSLDLITNKRR